MAINLSRRSFLRGLAAGAGAFSLAACNAKSADSPSQNWTAVQDDELDCLTTQVAGGNVVAMPGDGWAPREGYIQLQLGGGSIPGQEIEAVRQEGSTLTVTLKSDGDVSTLNMLLTEYRLESDQANVDVIEVVKVDYGNGDVQELEKSYD